MARIPDANVRVPPDSSSTVRGVSYVTLGSLHAPLMRHKAYETPLYPCQPSVHPSSLRGHDSVNERGTHGCLSRSSTLAPRSRRVCAAERPARPPPTTITWAMTSSREDGWRGKDERHAPHSDDRNSYTGGGRRAGPCEFARSDATPGGKTSQSGTGRTDRPSGTVAGPLVAPANTN